VVYFSCLINYNYLWIVFPSSDRLSFFTNIVLAWNYVVSSVNIMPNKCEIINCNGNYNNDNECRVYRLPKEDSEKQNWLDVLPPHQNFTIEDQIGIAIYAPHRNNITHRSLSLFGLQLILLIFNWSCIDLLTLHTSQSLGDALDQAYHPLPRIFKCTYFFFTIA